MFSVRDFRKGSTWRRKDREKGREREREKEKRRFSFFLSRNGAATNGFRDERRGGGRERWLVRRGAAFRIFSKEKERKKGKSSCRAEIFLLFRFNKIGLFFSILIKKKENGKSHWVPAYSFPLNQPNYQPTSV